MFTRKPNKRANNTAISSWSKHTWTWWRLQVPWRHNLSLPPNTTHTCFRIANGSPGCDEGCVSIPDPIHRHVGHLSGSQRVSARQTQRVQQIPTQPTQLPVVGLILPTGEKKPNGLPGCCSTELLQKTSWGNRRYRNIFPPSQSSSRLFLTTYRYMVATLWGACVCLVCLIRLTDGRSLSMSTTSITTHAGSLKRLLLHIYIRVKKINEIVWIRITALNV